MMSSMCVQCSRVSFYFGKVAALQDVTLGMDFGSIVALVGPNGAGKTTLLEVLSGSLRPTAGNCRVLGIEVKAAFASLRLPRAGLARTFQRPRVVGRLSVADNIFLAGAPRWQGNIRGLRRRCTEMLEDFSLDGVAHTPGRELSYGQRKLLALCCCLVRRPSLTLLDEPFSGVDPTMLPRLLRAVRQLKHPSAAVVIVEHDFEVLREIVDTVTVLDQGTVVTQGEAPSFLGSLELAEVFYG